MSGIRTMHDLRGRCRIEGDCWIWAGAYSNGTPRAWGFDRDRGEMRSMPATRLSWQLTNARAIGGQTIYRLPKCIDARCVNPYHLARGTREDAGRATAESGRLKQVPARVLANVKNGRLRSPMTLQLRSEILSSDETNVAIAKRLGLSHTTISSIRRGHRWRPLAGSSVFALAA